MHTSYDVLILGASYGSLLGSKLLLAGHDVTLVCRPSTAQAINKNGLRLRMPVAGKHEPLEIDSRELPGTLAACGPGEVDPRNYDLVVLAMQEPQYGSDGVRELLDEIATSRVPCMSIMNMPLPTNFKAARFDSDEYTDILRTIQAHISVVRYHDHLELPVKLKVSDSVFVPLAKWPMLITGNYRCVQVRGPRSTREAVHSDLDVSREIFNWVCELCIKIGAAPADLVPFEKYAEAAQHLTTPSSAARALFEGATDIERVDRLVQAIATQVDMHSPVVDEMVALIDTRLAGNRISAEERRLISA